jgi:hypothetical protein
MRAHLKGLSARIVMSSESMATCASGLPPNPAKVPYFQYRAWWYFIVQKFHNDGKKIQELQFWAYFDLRPWSYQSPRISKLGMMIFYRLEISYWWLKIIFYFCSCPVTDQKPKNVLPISVVTRNLLFILFLSFYRNFKIPSMRLSSTQHGWASCASNFVQKPTATRQTETRSKPVFYFPHMKYGKYWFHLQKNFYFLLLIFTF